MFHEEDELSKAENAMDLKITGLAVNGSISDYRSLQANCELDVLSEFVGSFFLLRSSPRTFVWGWEIRGTHICDLALNLSSIYELLNEGLLNIPYNLDWEDVHIGDEATNHNRTQQPNKPNKEMLPSQTNNVSRRR